jgi:undecaprenyl diphosphate synthase
MTRCDFLIGGETGKDFSVAAAQNPARRRILHRLPACATFRAGHPSSDLPVKTSELWKPANRQEADLLEKLDPKLLPRHVAIIMDGNGRWAERRHLPRVAGHQRGVKAAREIIEACARLKLPCLTLYAFSRENWTRPQAEVEFLMRLLREYLKRELPTIHKNNIRLTIIGRESDLPDAVLKDLDRATQLTGGNTGMNLVVALNYGARAEIVDAFNSMLQQARAKDQSEYWADEEAIAAHLYTAGLPDPDLLIRTSGEMRVSNFLLWQIAYAEIYVTETLWPDFSRARLLEALIDYQKRERRYGGLGATRPKSEHSSQGKQSAAAKG